jgi:predicted RNA methylase
MDVVAAFRRVMMRTQHRVKVKAKPYLFEEEPRLRPVRFGPGRGVRLHLSRQRDLQREFGLYEAELHSIHRKHIRQSSVIYDVGAGDGLTALTFARLASKGHVYAFEADTGVLAVLERNLEANPSLRERVTIVPQAVGAVGQTALDSFAERPAMPVPHFVKIDVDGAELEVLEGMDQIAKQDRPTAVIEVHSSKLEDDCARWLADRSYAVTTVRNAWWRTFYPELRPIGHNRWLLAVGSP